MMLFAQGMLTGVLVMIALFVVLAILAERGEN